jgi:acetyltransferase-like isoleucine patch superfamily enzyme
MYIGEGTTIDRMCTLIGDVNIGEQCIIAPQVFISSHSHSYIGHVGVNIRELDLLASVKCRAISLYDQVWIGYSSIILPGTQIGKRSVIGALSKVQGDYSKGYLVINGNPGVVVKTIPVRET